MHHGCVVARLLLDRHHERQTSRDSGGMPQIGPFGWNPKAVANYILELGEREGIPISPMKLQKLVYYCQGWHLAITGHSLLDEQVEAWPYGPVVDTLFHEFKAFGNQPITERANSIVNWEDPFDLELVQPSIAAEAEDQDVSFETTQAVIDKVWAEYKSHSAVKLSNMTHTPGGPWDQIFREHNGKLPKGTDIPRPLLRSHFLESLARHMSEAK